MCCHYSTMHAMQNTDSCIAQKSQYGNPQEIQTISSQLLWFILRERIRLHPLQCYEYLSPTSYQLEKLVKSSSTESIKVSFQNQPCLTNHKYLVLSCWGNSLTADNVRGPRGRQASTGFYSYVLSKIMNRNSLFHSK